MKIRKTFCLSLVHYKNLKLRINFHHRLFLFLLCTKTLFALIYDNLDKTNIPAYSFETHNEKNIDNMFIILLHAISSQFHQHFTSSFCVDILVPNKLQTQTVT